MLSFPNVCGSICICCSHFRCSIVRNYNHSSPQTGILFEILPKSLNITTISLDLSILLSAYLLITPPILADQICCFVLLCDPAQDPISLSFTPFQCLQLCSNIQSLHSCTMVPTSLLGSLSTGIFPGPFYFRSD